MYLPASSRPSFSRLPLLTRIAAALLLTAGISPAAHATAVATTTQLSVPVPSVAAGVPTLLVATVTDASSHAVLLGTVTFYDGTRMLGAAQIVSRAGGSFTQGTANLKTASFVPGANSITAVFAGTIADLTSTSPAKTVTVTGKSQTTTALTVAVAQGQYTLTAALQAFAPFGAGVPTGSVDFLDAATGTSLGTVPLSGAEWTDGFQAGSIPAGITQTFNGSLPAVGDFNNDGFLDIATALSVSAQGAGGLGIQLGGGNGKFQAQAVYGSDGIQNIAVGDFHNSGILDAVAILSQNSEFEILPGAEILAGNGDGTFQFQNFISFFEPGFSEPVDVVVGDFNRDGNRDIAVTDNDVVVMLGNGDGTFQTAQDYSTGPSPSTLAVGDFNGDGIPDLIVIASNGEGVLLGKGDGTFHPQKFSSLGAGPYIALGDLNGDGKLDVVTSNTNQDALFVSLGNGDGTFQPKQTYVLPYPAAQPVILDVNRDGKPDIAAADPYRNNIEVLYGNGDGTFQPTVGYIRTIDTPNAMVQADFNGDGRPDLATENNGGFGGNILLDGTTTTLQLAGVSPPSAGQSLVEAAYAGDESFSGSQSSLSVFGDMSVQLNGGAVLDASGLHLTNGGTQETTSIFTTTPVDTNTFTTDFNFQMLNPRGDGFTFTIQTVGPDAIGGGGGGLGYFGIPQSLAIKFDLYNNAGEGPNSTGLYFDGGLPNTPAIDLTGTGINLHSGDPFHAHITYDGWFLTMTLTDAVTLASWSHAWQIATEVYIGPVPEIPSAAYVGFTGSTGGDTSTLTISSWTFFPGDPTPNFPLGFLVIAHWLVDPPFLKLNGGVTDEGNWLELTTYLTNQAGSAFYAVPQNIQSFTNDFTFQIVSPVADGFTFAIQNAPGGPTAVGGGGSGLGFSDLRRSVAIKFDLFNNAGEGSDSTGLYIDGARPTVPAIDLTGAGINLHSGDIFKAHMTYDGTNLTVTLTDTVTSATWSHSWPINIPATVGGDTAYVGFTGATGTATAWQEIETWTFAPGAR